MKKTTILQASILTTTLFLNTGCFLGYLGNQTMEPIQPTEPITYTQQPVMVAEPSILSTPQVECTDDETSSCTKERINIKELQPKVQTPSGGEVHNLRSFQGQTITILERSNGFVFPQYRNKTVILEMFGKNCSHCIKEMPIFNKIRSRARGAVEVIAVQVEDKMSPSEAKSLIRRHAIHYPIIAGDSATNLQYKIQTTYGWTGILPFTLVIKNGVTEFTYAGEVSYNEINRDLKSLQ